MSSIMDGGRHTRSAESIQPQGSSLFGRSTGLHGTGTRKLIDKASILWKDFLNSVRRRKLLLEKLRESAMETAVSESILKKQLLDLRQVTLSLIEDALEIEYRSQLGESSSSSNSSLVVVSSGKSVNNTSRALKFPPIKNFRSLEDKEDVHALAEMMTDVDDLLLIPNIRVLLPKEFPHTRNPFLLGKTVDELATMTTPEPEAGNLDEELKVLELLRCKRASKALIRAEVQVVNSLPINLFDTEKLIVKMSDDPNVEKLVRAASALVDNDRLDLGLDANMSSLTAPVFSIEGHQLLLKLNRFRGMYPMRIDVQIAIRQMLRDSAFDYLEDPVSSFLLEWINLVLSNSADLSKSLQRNYTAVPSSGFHRFNESLHGSSSSKHEKMLLSKHALEVNQKQYRYSDIASVISSNDGIKSTHENILVESKPMMKLRHHHPSEGRRSPSPDKQHLLEDRSVPSSPVFQAIAAGRRAAQESSRPTTKQFPSRPVTRQPPIDEEQPYAAESTANKMNLSDSFSSPNNYKGSQHRLVQLESMQPIITEPSKENARSKKNNLKLKNELSEEIDEKIRSQIEKMMKKMGGMKAPKVGGAVNLSAKEKEEAEETEIDRLSSVRYELFRMQQELLRKQVLDPKHYQLTSVDAMAQARSGLTVGDINTHHPDAQVKQRNIEKNEEKAKLVPLSEKVISTVFEGDKRHLVLTEILLDPVGEVLIGKILHRTETGGDSYMELGDDAPFSLRGALSNTLVTQRKVLRTETHAFTIVSKLIYNRLTKFLFSDLMTSKPEMMGKMLQNIIDQLHNLATDETPLPKGRFLIQANRVLFTNKFAEDGVLVDLTILRNDECDGLIIHCLPVAGIYNRNRKSTATGPVTILVHDRELKVLFANQYGLFVAATSRWSAMEMVAQWIAQRLSVRKVKTLDTTAAMVDDTIIIDGENSRSPTAVPGNVVLEEPSFFSAITYDESTPAVKAVEEQLVIAAAAVSRPSTSTRGGMKKPNMLVILDVQLDRKVEISNNLQMQWKSRNIPSIAGMEVILTAVQELEMLVINVKIVLPLPDQFRALKKKDKARKLERSDGLLDMAGYSDDDESEVPGRHVNATEPVVVELSYRLTSSELSIFGSSELVDGKKLTLSQSDGAAANTTAGDEKHHPETFIWNVLNRLKVSFKGTRKDPFQQLCSANDSSNWDITYIRRLAKDVRTVSRHVLLCTVSAVGEELLVDAEPVDQASKVRYESRMVSGDEIADIVHTEGMPLSLIDYHRRKKMASTLLDKIKVVADPSTGGGYRVELYTFAETQMLKITIFGGKLADADLGYVEINNHSTLSDVRILIRHELDVEDVPKQYRFLYKGAQCSIKQEAFRRACECLPTCFIVVRAVEVHEISIETEDIQQRRVMQQHEEQKVVQVEHRVVPAVERSILPPGQRRAAGKWSAIAVPTLCHVKEGSRYVSLLHEAVGLLREGDLVRIGNIIGRDFLVVRSSDDFKEQYPQSVEIEPAYDISDEPDFTSPIAGNYYYPFKGAGKYYDPVRGTSVQTLKSYRDFGCYFDIPTPPPPQITAADDTTTVVNSTDRQIEAAVAVASSPPPPSKSNNNAIDVYSKTFDPTIGGGIIMMVSDKGAGKRKKRTKGDAANLGYFDCWIWKCIPAKEDTRPKWLELYENGEVPYNYELKESKAFERHFRVKAPHSYLEVLCTDSRCPDLTLHAQRVQEMLQIPIDYYADLIYRKMTDWSPSYKGGVERTKFLRLVKDTMAFPDIKKQARISQLELVYQRHLRVSEHSIVGKYLMFLGFCQLLREVALIRYPHPSSKQAGLDDNASVDGSESVVSLESAGSLNSGDSKTRRNRTSSRMKKKQTDKGKKKKKMIKVEEEQPAEEVVVDMNATDPAYLQEVYAKFILDLLMTHSDWYSIAWREAKVMAIKREAITYCAATRIQAAFRRHVKYRMYRFVLRQYIKLQANVRRRISAKKTLAFIRLLQEDWCLRVRYMYATMIQSLIRRYLKRCWFVKAMNKIKQQEVLVVKAKRLRMKKLRALAKKAIIFKKIKRMNGVIVYLRILRKDARTYTRDCSLTIEIYVPKDQASFKFPIEDADLRSYMQLDLGLEVLSLGQLLDPVNLEVLVSTRIMVHKPSSKYAKTHVNFSKHGLGQRGELALTRGKRIRGEFFVCKIFESGDEVSVQLYHRLSCKVFSCHMPVLDMRAWIREETIVMDELQQHQELPLLRPENKKQYYQWVLDHLTIDTRKGVFNVLFLCQLTKSTKLEMVKKIQAVWRRALVKPLLIRMLDAVWLKVKTQSWEQTFYYLDLRTGASSWEKPKLLGSADLITQPSRRWVAYMFYDNDKGIYKQFYVNPWTGRYTSYTPNEAVKLIQALVRNSILLRPLLMPLAHFVKAGKIVKHAESTYNSTNPKRLATVINYAMVSHVVNLDEVLAKKLYAEAVELSEANPLVTRAYAFYMIGTCEPPVKLNRDRFMILLRDAERKDPTHEKFTLAYYLFQFSCVKNPSDIRALINLALVQCLLFSTNTLLVQNAEKLMRRALALSPFDERILEIWNFLRDRFPERQLLYSSPSRIHKVKVEKDAKTRIVHGRPVVENPDWAGWVHVVKDPMNISRKYKNESYWYNPADGTEQPYPPDFRNEWVVRKSRSLLHEEEHGLQQYFDPLTSEHFQYHPLTDSFA